MLEQKVDAAHELWLLNGGGLAGFAINISTEEWGKEKNTILRGCFDFNWSSVTCKREQGYKPNSNSSDSRPPPLWGNSASAWKLASEAVPSTQCQWHFKAYLMLALVLLLWNQSPPLAVSVGTHSSTPAAPFFSDPLHLLCSTLNTARRLSAPGIQTSSHWHFVPARDFSRWHFTQKKASMSLAVESKAKAAHAGDALTQKKPALVGAWDQAILAQYLQNLPGPCCDLLLSGALLQDTTHHIQGVQGRPQSWLEGWNTSPARTGGVVQLGEEKAPGRLYCSLPALKRNL